MRKGQDRAQSMVQNGDFDDFANLFVQMRSASELKATEVEDTDAYAFVKSVGTTYLTISPHHTTNANPHQTKREVSCRMERVFT